MNERVKFQVLNIKGRWRTAYCNIWILPERIQQWTQVGFTVRVNDNNLLYRPAEKAA